MDSVLFEHCRRLGPDALDVGEIIVHDRLFLLGATHSAGELLVESLQLDPVAVGCQASLPVGQNGMFLPAGADATGLPGFSGSPTLLTGFWQKDNVFRTYVDHEQGRHAIWDIVFVCAGVSTGAAGMVVRMLWSVFSTAPCFAAQLLTAGGAAKKDGGEQKRVLFTADCQIQPLVPGSQDPHGFSVAAGCYGEVSQLPARQRSRTNTSGAPLVSPLTRLGAWE